MGAKVGVRLVCILSITALACGGDDDDVGGDRADGGPGNVSEVPGLLPDRVAVPIPDSVQATQRCVQTAAEQQLEELVKHVEQAQEVSLAQFRFVDLMVGAVAGGEADSTYSEAGSFDIEVSDGLAAQIAADVADYPDLAFNPPPAGFVFASPRFCYRKNLAGEFSNAFYLDRYGFAEGAGCDDLDRYMTRFEWNDDRTLFRIRVTRYEGFFPPPHFNYFYDQENPLPDGAGDVIAGYVTYTYDGAAGREWFRLATRNENSVDGVILDGVYEMTGTMQECGADECLAFQLAVNVIGELYDRVEIYAGQGDDAGVVMHARQAQREGMGTPPTTYWGDDQAIVDGAGCVLWQRSLGLDGYGPWEGEGTGDATAAPFYTEVIENGIDFNSADIDFSGLAGLPDSVDDLPLIFAIVRGGGEPASEPDVLGVGYAVYANSELFVPYLYWGTDAEVADADVYIDDWNATDHTRTFTPVPGNLAISP